MQNQHGSVVLKTLVALAFLGCIAFIVWSGLMVYETFSVLLSTDGGVVLAMTYSIWTAIALAVVWDVSKNIHYRGLKNFMADWNVGTTSLIVLFSVPIIMFGSALIDNGKSLRQEIRPVENEIVLIRAVVLEFNQGQIRFAPILKHKYTEFYEFEIQNAWNRPRVCSMQITKTIRPQDYENLAFAQPGMIVVVSVAVPYLHTEISSCAFQNLWSEPLAIRPLPPDVFVALEET